MPNPEQRENWTELVRHLDELPLAELARRYGGKPGQIVGALQRTGVVRGSGVAAEDDLPPELGEVAMSAAPDDAGQRAGSKDALIARHAASLGSVPDAELAERAGVSARTVASYRARHGIAGFRGPGRPPAAERSPSIAQASGARAWIAVLRRGSVTTRVVVIASDIQSAIAEAEGANLGVVDGISYVGPVRGA